MLALDAIVDAEDWADTELTEIQLDAYLRAREAELEAAERRSDDFLNRRLRFAPEI